MEVTAAETDHAEFVPATQSGQAESVLAEDVAAAVPAVSTGVNGTPAAAIPAGPTAAAIDTAAMTATKLPLFIT
ncbi:hypothetical protein EBN03_23695 [Nocardia stercoris]|uniref:Uncharacterized protein n=1 Tax=Nocardia stercoris TaxID=2483361 RepID=A0A3M2KW34_9NOCA|nr:hypothetical protein EBN03_23695 [Nocardia stercoris]